MIIEALIQYLNPKFISKSRQYRLGCEIVKRREGLIKIIAPDKANILLILNSNEIAFSEYLAILKDYLCNEKCIGKVQCNWFVCSSKGGIYLYEALATKENIRNMNLINRFIVFNVEDGTISLGPGNVLNKLVSERMAYLLMQINEYPKEVVIKEMKNVFDLCVNSLR